MNTKMILAVVFITIVSNNFLFSLLKRRSETKEIKRKMYKKQILILCGILFSAMIYSQQGFVHEQSKGYVWPEEENVLKKLDNWQDIDMGRIAVMARSNRPDLLIVDRTVRGKYENYQTPERSVPAEQLPYPWESCISLSSDWGWIPNATFKTPVEMIVLPVIKNHANLPLVFSFETSR